MVLSSEKSPEKINGIHVISEEPYHIIQPPNRCPEGTKPDATGKCRTVWSLNLLPKQNKHDDDNKKMEGIHNRRNF